MEEENAESANRSIGRLDDAVLRARGENPLLPSEKPRVALHQHEQIHDDLGALVLWRTLGELAELGFLAFRALLLRAFAALLLRHARRRRTSSKDLGWRGGSVGMKVALGDGGAGGGDSGNAGASRPGERRRGPSHRRRGLRVGWSAQEEGSVAPRDLVCLLGVDDVPSG